MLKHPFISVQGLAQFLIPLVLLTGCQVPADSGATFQPVIDQEAKTRIDETLQTFVSEGTVAGASALIIERGEEVYFHSVGYADREAQVPMDRHTIATIYSMTKPVTGVALMKLYEAGKFKLDDPLSQYLPEFADMQVAVGLDESGNQILEPAKRPITIADITRHTAGFSTRQDLGLDKLAGAADLLNMESTLEEMAAKLSQIPLGYHPGERWEYGISVSVQAYLVEKLAGMPFHEYLQEVVLDPLGMEETGYVVPEENQSRVAAIYSLTDSSLDRVPDQYVHTINFQDWPMKPGGWGLTATIDDYMTFAQMLVNEGSHNGASILKPETVELMATNHLPTLEDSLWLPGKGRVGFGIDFAVRTDPPQSPEEMNGVVGEFFWDGAASTLFWVDPANEMTVVLFVQVFPFQNHVHKRFRDAVYGAVEVVEEQ
ncbi:serine hydrolase domain-containing protein [Pontibacter sp. G13]|uniref:serine hydrolase domain-containing protein n=1 Tax=Pontibacter sp. G13 TaxID=3074898 RepID=UPI00288B42FC|nr:serine hydrolase domain-containing protein [Pontibacter sp. G13]WNJ17159.1 serine hydrolase domain-containing protein [Pontibacter sp. G13]